MDKIRVKPQKWIKINMEGRVINSSRSPVYAVRSPETPDINVKMEDLGAVAVMPSETIEITPEHWVFSFISTVTLSVVGSTVTADNREYSLPSASIDFFDIKSTMESGNIPLPFDGSVVTINVEGEIGNSINFPPQMSSLKSSSKIEIDFVDGTQDIQSVDLTVGVHNAKLNLANKTWAIVSNSQTETKVG